MTAPVALSLAPAASVAAVSSVSTAAEGMICTVTDECRDCTSNDREQIDRCEETGKVERVTCISDKDHDDEEEGMFSFCGT
jgi:hypothetical protein